MSNFGTIYKYELRKIAGKKLFVISFILCAVISLSGFYFRYMGNVYIDDVLVGTNAEYHKQDIAYAKALDSRVIDDELLSEMVSAYRKVPYVTDRHYTGTEEYQKYARPYSAIFNFVRQCGGYGTAYLMYEWQPSEADFYVKRGEMLENSWKDLFLSESEKQFWREKEVGIQKPFTFYETTAYDEMFAVYQTAAIMLLIVISINLAGVFANESSRRTDRIILCTKNGRTMLYLAKISAGITVCAGSALLISVLIWVTATIFYGFSGANAAFQFIYQYSSLPINCLQAVLISFAMLIVTTVMFGVMVMLLSLVTRSSIASMAISISFLISAMLISSLPDEFRVMAQLWDSLPWMFNAVWSIFSERTFPGIGTRLTPYQAVPLIYLAVGAIFSAAGGIVWKKRQTVSR